MCTGEYYKIIQLSLLLLLHCPFIHMMCAQGNIIRLYNSLSCSCSTVPLSVNVCRGEYYQIIQVLSPHSPSPKHNTRLIYLLILCIIIIYLLMLCTVVLFIASQPLTSFPWVLKSICRLLCFSFLPTYDMSSKKDYNYLIKKNIFNYIQFRL